MMLWPIPINIRMNPIRASQLLDINAQCATEEREIIDFPEYGSTLNEKQLIRLKAFAEEVIRSHDSHSPIAAISIIGHADRAMKEPLQKRAVKEQEVSDKRAKNGNEQFEEMMKSLSGGSRVLAMIHTKAQGIGSKELVIQHPINEEQMRRNRRIVFKWSRCLLPTPIIHPPLEFPPHTPLNPDDDPNVVFAGNKFKMKILSGISAGEVVGVFSYHFLIVDIDNKRSAEYVYKGVIGTVGVPPFTESGESDFSNPFSTISFIQVDQFSTDFCNHDSGSIGIVSGMRFTLGRGTLVRLQMEPSQRTITIFAGPSKSIGVESGKGSLKLIPGSVAVFRK
jgi:hypothetical protein